MPYASSRVLNHRWDEQSQDRNLQRIEMRQAKGHSTWKSQGRGRGETRWTLTEQLVARVLVPLCCRLRAPWSPSSTTTPRPRRRGSSRVETREARRARGSAERQEGAAATATGNVYGRRSPQSKAHLTSGTTNCGPTWKRLGAPRSVDREAHRTLNSVSP
jgi:hypothetical protein